MRLWFNCMILVFYSLMMHDLRYEQETSDQQSIVNEPSYGVLDRVSSNGNAIILFESLGTETIIDKSLLPDQSEVGTWFYVIIEERKVILTIDPAKTWLEQQRAIFLNNRLQQSQPVH